MGVGGGIRRGARAQSHVAYYVALGVILILLFMLCLYFFYYFIRKVNQLRHVESFYPTPTLAPSRPPPPPPPVTAAYPVQPVVRESASAMAKLCKQLPPQPAAVGKGGTVFPAAASPPAQRADTAGPPAPAPASAPAPAPPKLPQAVPVATATETLAR